VAKDYFHPIVKAALIQEGWDVTDDPLEIKVGGVDMEIDLGAERVIAAERQGQKIAVEVKSFLTGTSAISEFHRALGQFINYRAALKTEMPDRILYLAVPLVAFNTFFQLDFPKSRVEENQVKLLVYDTLSQRELLWIPEITHK
jgi:XisH protein